MDLFVSGLKDFKEITIIQECPAYPRLFRVVKVHWDQCTYNTPSKVTDQWQNRCIMSREYHTSRVTYNSCLRAHVCEIISLTWSLRAGVIRRVHVSFFDFGNRVCEPCRRHKMRRNEGAHIGFSSQRWLADMISQRLFVCVLSALPSSQPKCQTIWNLLGL
jgi:hypothetical protein